MKKIGLALCLFCAMVLVVNLNCAVILDGAKASHERTDEVMWGYVVADVLFTGLIGLIIDFSTGAIYKSNESSSEIEQDLNKCLSKGIPCYRLREDGVYKIEMKDGQLKESKVERGVIPLVVWQSIEKEKSSRMVSVPQFAH